MLTSTAIRLESLGIKVWPLPTAPEPGFIWVHAPVQVGSLPGGKIVAVGVGVGVSVGIDVLVGVGVSVGIGVSVAVGGGVSVGVTACSTS